MLGQLGNGAGTIIIMLLAGVLFRIMFHWNKTFFNDKPATIEDYLYKIARITGKSEFDIFLKSAKEWPITKEKVEEDFKAYLKQQAVPRSLNVVLLELSFLMIHCLQKKCNSGWHLWKGTG